MEEGLEAWGLRGFRESPEISFCLVQGLLYGVKNLRCGGADSLNRSVNDLRCSIQNLKAKGSLGIEIYFKATS